MSLHRLSFRSAPLALLALAGCVSAPTARQAVVPVAPPTFSTQGLESVMGRDAGVLRRMFGQEELDVREGSARKLQFVGPACVLDAYLYPPRGGGEAVVTYLDARLPDGRDFDRASCVAALTAARAGR